MKYPWFKVDDENPSRAPMVHGGLRLARCPQERPYELLMLARALRPLRYLRAWNVVSRGTSLSLSL